MSKDSNAPRGDALVGAGPRPRFDWRTASYADWNQQLGRYFLGTARNGAEVDRIPASPEELPSAVDDPSADPTDVVAAFVQVVRNEIPQGKSFCSYCLGRPVAEDLPHFFGMLWFTCLLAAGFPEGVGSFRDRFKSVVGKDDQCRHGPDQRDCLNALWEMLAAWTQSRDDYAHLILPPIEDGKVAIGRSYYLAFPNRKDRKALARVLADTHLLGFEPPIIPVVRSIEEARGRFSAEFRAKLEQFHDRYIRAGRDPTESPFWRAIRSVATEDVLEDTGTQGVGGVTLVATWDDDETLLVRLASRTATAPEGMQARELLVPLDGATHYLTDPSGSATAVVELTLRGDIPVSLGLAALVRQGVLVFVEDLAGEYRLATGEDIDGADLALVKVERANAFREAFGGTSDESKIEGWYEISGCRVRQLAQLPAELTGTTQLLHTTRTPRPRIVGGIAVAGGYLWNPYFQPQIRSPSASEVSCGRDDQWLSCTPADEPGDWALPPSLRVVPPDTLEVRAQFDTYLGDRLIRRRSKTRLRFVERGHGCAYKSVGAGIYWREGCDPEQAEHKGGDLVDLGITTSDSSASADLVGLDPSARYLGPGLGEMSRETRDDHPWLALGPKNAPHDLVFVGDLERPVLPDGGVSENKGDRRAWSRAFRSARVTARIADRYVSLASEPRLQHIHSLYRRRASRTEVDVGEPRICPAAELDSCGVPKSPREVSPDRSTMAAVEVLSALGLSRSGILLRELNEIMARLTGRHDYLLWQQVVRAWSEAGLIDLLRRQDRSATLVVPRSPRFVMVRRGPAVEARLVGLAPSAVLDTIRGLVGTKGLSWLMPTSPFQPPLLRLTGLDPERVSELARRVGLARPEWLWWPAVGDVPPHLRIREVPGGLSPGAPPDAYRFDAMWDWRDMVFRLHPKTENTALVTVERRRHAERCSIFVVIVDGDPMLWCHLRSWALIRAAELWEKPPFRTSSNGVISSRGISPMHLPLPLARLCTAIGFGLPGPELGADHRVNSYRYPFGARPQCVVQRMLPSHWIEDASEDE